MALPAFRHLLKVIPFEHEGRQAFRVQDQAENLFDHAILLPPAAFVVATFLDGCAGMGAVGIEAISRGAVFVYFVEQSRKACQMIRENLKELDVQDGYKIIEMDLCKALGTVGRVDIAFVDPPYDRDDL